MYRKDLRPEIVDSFIAEFNEFGPKLTLDRVSSRIHISKKTIYRFFRSKDEIYSYILKQAARDVAMGQKAVLEDSSLSPAEKVRRILTVETLWESKIGISKVAELTEEAPAMISEVWYKKVTDHITGETYWEAVMPDIDGEKDPKQIRAKVERFEENMRNAEKNGNATRTLQKGTFAKPFKVAKHKNEHVVFVNVNGKQKMIIIQGNPRPAQAINGDTASDVTAGRLMRGMSAMFTSYNITFSVTNTSRDTFFANNNVAIREDAAY